MWLKTFIESHLFIYLFSFEPHNEAEVKRYAVIFLKFGLKFDLPQRFQKLSGFILLKDTVIIHKLYKICLWSMS